MKKKGIMEKSEQLLNEALEILKFEYGKGENHPDIAKSLNDLGELHLLNGRLDESLKLLEESLEMNRRVFRFQNGEHPDIATTMHNIGLVMKKQGRNIDEIKEKYGKEALRMREKYLGKEHPLTIECAEEWGD